MCGPTASGKTALAIELSKKFNGEVVSSDSMQIYKGMDIGTAKPTKEEMCCVPHHMIDVTEIDIPFSVSDYCTMAKNIINDIYARNKLPVLAGGTGLYVDSLINNIDFSESSVDLSAREKYAGILEKSGNLELHNILKRLDPKAAESIHYNNSKRVIRALEHIEITGELFSEYKERAASNKSPYNSLMFFIDMDREILYERINMRVDLMIEMGLLDEAKSIYDMGFDRTLTSMCAIGYKELFDFFDGICSLDEAIEAIKQNSRRYAKRQLTWFRRNQNLIHLKYDKNIIENAVKKTEEWLEINFKEYF